MLNFFVTLSNTVGIPTVLIGTSKAQQLFKGNFRQARRAASDGSIIWDRMEEDSEGFLLRNSMGISMFKDSFRTNRRAEKKHFMRNAKELPQ